MNCSWGDPSAVEHSGLKYSLKQKPSTEVSGFCFALKALGSNPMCLKNLSVDQNHFALAIT
jgi:hypothetical protein